MSKHLGLQPSGSGLERYKCLPQCWHGGAHLSSFLRYYCLGGQGNALAGRHLVQEVDLLADFPLQVFGRGRPFPCGLRGALGLQEGA